jgi:hypothetical protein
MASAHGSVTGLTAVTGWPEQGKSWTSTFPVSESHSFYPVTNGASVDNSTSINTARLFGISYSFSTTKNSITVHCLYHTSTACTVGCCCSGAVRSLCNFKHKCQKLQIYFI